MHFVSKRRVGITALVALLALAGCGTSQPTSGSSAPTAALPSANVQAPEQPVAPEQNPVGDIPDNQAFVTYTASPGGYTLEAPEGWARTANGTAVQFVSTFDGMSVTLTPASAAPTATTNDPAVVALMTAGRAVEVKDVKSVTLPAGNAVLIISSANSEPDPVTNKQVRLEQNTYVFFKNGTQAMLNLWAPQGADNVDQWNRIAQSFRWQ